MNLRVLALGNRYRQDDGVGPWVARHLREAGLEVYEVGDDLTRLVEGLAGADEAWVVEAVVSGRPAGSLHVMEVGPEPLPSVFERLSSHSFGLVEALELARTLGSLPPRTVIYGIEGQQFGPGEGLSPAVQEAAQALLQTLRTALGLSGNAPVTRTNQSEG